MKSPRGFHKAMVEQSTQKAFHISAFLVSTHPSDAWTCNFCATAKRKGLSFAVVWEGGNDWGTNSSCLYLVQSYRRQWGREPCMVIQAGKVESFPHSCPLQASQCYPALQILPALPSFSQKKKFGWISQYGGWLCVAEMLVNNTVSRYQGVLSKQIFMDTHLTWVARNVARVGWGVEHIPQTQKLQGYKNVKTWDLVVIWDTESQFPLFLQLPPFIF